MRGRVVAGAAAAALATVAVGGGAVVLTRSGEALPGTTVAGVDVGGTGRSAVERVVRDLGDDRTTGILLVQAADVDAPVDRSLAEADVAATVDRALSAGRRGPVDAVLGPLLGGLLTDEQEQAVELVLDVDEPGLRDRLAEVAGAVDRPPADGGFTVDGTTVTAVPPQDGRALVVDEALDDVAAALRGGAPGPLVLPVEEISPTATPADVDGVVAQARAALAAPYSLVHEGTTLRVSPERLAPLLSSAVVDGRLALQVDRTGLAEVVAARAASVDRRPVDAALVPVSPPPAVTTQGDLTWVPRPAQLSVRPGAPGLAVDVPAATEVLLQAVLAGDQAPGPLPAQVTPPALSTEQAPSAGITTLLGTFTTSFTAGQPRATNIRRIAELVDGAYIAPGETFSLNDTAGRRTTARGFVADGAIVDGELTDEVGGGVSQFATTLFNAAFFAGLPIPEHKPHSFYISRYPAGRESTVYFGQIDVQVRNDTATGISVHTRSTPGSVTVALYGDNRGRQVTSTSGPREPRGDGGFRISVTRTITGGDGRGERRVFRTSYDPAPED